MSLDVARGLAVLGTEVPERELPSSFRDVGCMGWVREPLDDAVRARRQVIAPPATATMGTPAPGAKGALLAQLREPNTVFMTGDTFCDPRVSGASGRGP